MSIFVFFSLFKIVNNFSCSVGFILFIRECLFGCNTTLTWGVPSPKSVRGVSNRSPSRKKKFPKQA